MKKKNTATTTNANICTILEENFNIGYTTRDDNIV